MISFIAKRPRTWLFIVKYALKLATLEDAEKALPALGIRIKGLLILMLGLAWIWTCQRIMQD